MSNFKYSIIIGLFFFIAGLVTLPHYGINWDTINHLPRGQAYLRYFLTGNTDYSDLPEWQRYYQRPESLYIDTEMPKDLIQKRSLYEDASFRWYISHESGGHPVVSDILAAGFNQVFFKKLGLINDVDSYRLYGIFLSACLVGLIFWWVSKLYGKLSGLFSALSLALYPLFWAESHFNNEKDIPEAVYWSFLIFSIWRGVVNKNWKWIIASGVLFGLALGTKFNVLFIIFIIIPWLCVYIISSHINKEYSLSKWIIKNKSLVVSSLLIPIIGGIIFFVSWPYLWTDPIAHVWSVVKFYKSIGITSNTNANFTGVFGVNTYPVKWIVYTTPPVILFFASVGIVGALLALRKSGQKVQLLFLLWLLVPIIRVSWPGATIYGGIRQIMEYVPAMAIFSGIGVHYILNWLSKKMILKLGFCVILSLLFIAHTYTLVLIHPAENVYFNNLIGGLKGAQEKNIPSWGNSFGGSYRQGVEWLNNHAPIGSKVVLARELMPNIPSIWFRSDLSISNGYRSGYLKKGEYVIGLVYEGTRDYSYFDGYIENFLIPVYEIKVDGVAVLKVWQNSELYAKPGWTERLSSDVVMQKTDTGLRFDLGKVQKLSRLEIIYSDESCQQLESGFTRISPDGENWDQLIGTFPKYWRIPAIGQQPANGKFIEPFVGQEDRFIDLVLSPADTCLKNIKDFMVYYFL